ncbi:MAG: CHASE domain-containing protein [Nitrospinae bacterium]|nr:CHASE domain-containing protein [Nitrospinota bacterium]
MKPSPKGSLKQNIVETFFQKQTTAWSILIFSLVLTALAWYIADHAVEKRISERLHFQSLDLVTAIKKRMLEYEMVLHSGIGLFKASSEVTRDEWKTFVENIEIQKFFPGIQGIGFSLMVPPDQKEKHEKEIQAEGFPHFKINPKGERDMYSSIVFLEPFDWRNQRAFGYDMYSQATRRAAMERARDTGEAAISGRVTLVQETDKDVQYGFLLYLPLYQKGKPVNSVKERRASLIGFVYSPFRIKDLMSGILLAGQGDISFELYDSNSPSPKTVLYNHENTGRLLYGDKNLKPRYDDLQKITIGGRVWSIYLYAKPGFSSSSEKSQPLIVAFGGILVDVLLFFIILSISRRKKLAESIANEMTSELQEKTQELARSNDQLEQFVYTVSHDLKSPLVTSMGFIGIINDLARKGEYEKALEKLDKVVVANQRMGQLINDLLELSRVGRVDLEKKTLDMNVLIGNLCKEKEKELKGKNITLICEENFPDIYGNGSRVLQIFENLLSNAMKYGKNSKEGSKISIGSEEKKNEVVFYMSDNGIGIAKEFHEKIFGLFQRLDNSGEGTGIGLAITKKAVEFHGGRIWLESKQGEGTTFYVAFPTVEKSNEVH